MHIAISGATTFLSRLRLLLAGRNKHPWGESLGLSSGMISRMFEGHVPNTEILTAICRVEGCSLHWLLLGEGMPFPVTPWNSDAEAAAHLKTVLANEPSEFTIYVLSVTMAGPFGVVLTRPRRITRPSKRVVNYTEVHIYTGAIGELTLKRVRAVQDSTQLWRVQTSADQLERLMRGEVGTWQLIGNDDHHGLLAHTFEDLHALDELIERASQISGSPVHSMPTLDVKALETSIVATREGLSRRGMIVPPEREAQLIAALYRIAISGQTSEELVDAVIDLVR